MNLLIGRLHPLLVHLPIGILLIAILFEWLSRKERFRLLKPAIPVLLWSGSVTAVASCATGYMLSIQNDYDQDILPWHLGLGISTAALSIGLFFIQRSPMPGARKAYNAGCIALLLFIGITGHLGGSLTHGSAYITEVLPATFTGLFSPRESKSREIVNVQNALVFNDIVKPIFEEKCITCHGESRQKGGLRLDRPDAIAKGGKKGKTVVVGNPFESEMIMRIYLPLSHEHHMPPKGKSQITPAEVQLLQWWITGGMSFDKKVSDFPQPETIKPILEGLQSSDPEKTIFASTDIPETDVRKIPDSVLTAFRNRNITIVPVARDSHYLSASFIAMPDASDQTLKLLLPLAQNIVSLRLGNTKITDDSFQTISQFKNLIRLNLERTAITDNGLTELRSLGELKYINFVGTPVTAKGILELLPLKKLKRIYLFQTSVESKDWPILAEKFKGVVFDKGGYEVPTFESDTTKVSVKK